MKSLAQEMKQAGESLGSCDEPESASNYTLIVYKYIFSLKA